MEGLGGGASDTSHPSTPTATTTVTRRIIATKETNIHSNPFIPLEVPQHIVNREIIQRIYDSFNLKNTPKNLIAGKTKCFKHNWFQITNDSFIRKTIIEPQHEFSNNVAFLAYIDLNESVQPPVKPRNSKCCSVSSLTIRVFKRLANALIRLCIRAGWSEPLLVAHTTL